MKKWFKRNRKVEQGKPDPVVVEHADEEKEETKEDEKTEE